MATTPTEKIAARTGAGGWNASYTNSISVPMTFAVTRIDR
jgi:hypothetical protein